MNEIKKSTKKAKRKHPLYVDNSPKILYFAYGSNMNQERLEWRIGKVKKIGTTRIPLYRLEFNCGTASRYFANMVMTGRSSDFIEGVLYEVSEIQLRQLDAFEGCPYAYQKFVYQGHTSDIYAYICINPLYKPIDLQAKVEKDYLLHILKGCAENNLSHTYNLVWSTYKHVLQEKS
jgi:gamma-glutamylcyclotransferase (GGCT)/AIG2-like uncharacterized protein YtfP